MRKLINRNRKFWVKREQENKRRFWMKIFFGKRPAGNLRRGKCVGKGWEWVEKEIVQQELDWKWQWKRGEWRQRKSFTIYFVRTYHFWLEKQKRALKWTSLCFLVAKKEIRPNWTKQLHDAIEYTQKESEGERGRESERERERARTGVLVTVNPDGKKF